MPIQTEPHRAAQDTAAPLAPGRIHQGDCIELMQQMEAESVDLAFADPPFNIGYDYDQYDDTLEDEHYIDWSTAWMREVHRVLKPNGTFWLAIGDEYAAELKVAAQQIGFVSRSWVVWYYTFGVNCKRKFSRSHAHLLHFIKDAEDFTFNAEDPAVRVLSARALVYGDKRANPNGRLPDDTWITLPAADGKWVLRPQDLPAGFETMDDTWYYARVAGTFLERQGFHGCQMPEQLLGRIIRVSSSPGDRVLDPFAGSGTTLAVAKKLGRAWIGCEVSGEYVRYASSRLASIADGDTLDGPADPIASAPSTANGRRLAGVAPPQEARPAQAETPPALAARMTERSITDEVAEEIALAQAASPKAPAPAALTEVSTDVARPDLRTLQRAAIVEAFMATHDGYSTDWLLASPALQDAFHAACREAGLLGSPADWNRALLRIRKSGHLPKRGTLRKVPVSAEALSDCGFGAEIAWRLASDKFPGSSLDEILCDPEKAACFDGAAAKYAPGFSAEQYRWAALRLRKMAKHLSGDAMKYAFIYEKLDFPARAQPWSRFKASKLEGQPGFYLLQAADKTPLFVDAAADLGKRLAAHADAKTFSRQVARVAVLLPEHLDQEYWGGLKLHLVGRAAPLLNMDLVEEHIAEPGNRE